MDKENVVHLHNEIFLCSCKQWYIKFADNLKKNELEKDHHEWGFPDPERITLHLLSYKWTFITN